MRRVVNTLMRNFSGNNPSGVFSRVFGSKRFLAFIAVGAMALVACGQAVSGNAEPAPDFLFTLYQGEDKLGGESLHLSDLQGRPVVINFWAGLCPPCRGELPDLQAFYDEYSPDIDLVSVDVGKFTGLGSQEDALKLLEDLDIDFPAGYAVNDSPLRDYRVLSMPTTVFLTADGEIFRKWSGVLNKEIAADITEEMLSST